MFSAHKDQPKNPSRLKVNLLHPQSSPEKLPVRFFRWLITYGRYIVIVVEIIVVAAFLLRFKLDADLNNLKDEINSTIPYIKDSAPKEALINQTQIRIATIKKVYQENPEWSLILNKLTGQIPSGIQLTSLSFDNSGDPKLTLKITGRTSSNNDLAAFLSGLKGDEKTFSKVSLTSIIFDQGEISFSIQAEVNPQAKL